MKEYEAPGGVRRGIPARGPEGGRSGPVGVAAIDEQWCSML